MAMTRFKLFFKPFWLAVQFLTRLPTPHYATVSAQEMGKAIAWFPLVGAIIGAGLVAVAQFNAVLPAHIVAGLVLAFWVWVTGALHLDGLADTADGWLGGTGNPQRALEIMKDSRIGTGGGVALGLMLLLKWSVLVVVIEHQAWWFLALAPVIGRIASIALMPVTAYVSANGIAEQMFNHLNRGWVGLWVLGLLLGLLWLHPGLAIGLILAWLWIRKTMQTITGGMTGDTAGATTELMELFWLMGVIGVLLN
jgi:adenosylcobinamide-GDP ribazoletransferase